MKKHDEGYVLAFVMVVVAVLSLISIAVSTISLRNIETQQKAVERMQDKYTAEGAIEIVVAELSDIETLVSATGIVSKDSAEEAIKNAIESKCPSDITLSFEADAMECTEVSETASDFSLKFTLNAETKSEIESEKDGEKLKITTTTNIGCEMELKGKISGESENNVTQYTITQPSIICHSHKTSITTEEVPVI